MEQTSQPQFETFDLNDLGNIDNAQTAVWFEVAKHDGSPSGLQFQVLGRDSEEWRKLNRHNLNKRFDKMAKTRKLKLTAEEQDAEGLELLCATVKNFRSRKYKRVDGVLVAMEPEDFFPTVNLGGEQLSFSKESLMRVFTKIPETREQLEDFQSARENFSKGSPKT